MFVFLGRYFVFFFGNFWKNTAETIGVKLRINEKSTPI